MIFENPFYLSDFAFKMLYANFTTVAFQFVKNGKDMFRLQNYKFCYFPGSSLAFICRKLQSKKREHRDS